MSNNTLAEKKARHAAIHKRHRDRLDAMNEVLRTKLLLDVANANDALEKERVFAKYKIDLEDAFDVLTGECIESLDKFIDEECTEDEALELYPEAREITESLVMITPRAIPEIPDAANLPLSAADLRAEDKYFLAARKHVEWLEKSIAQCTTAQQLAERFPDWVVDNQEEDVAKSQEKYRLAAREHLEWLGGRMTKYTAPQLAEIFPDLKIAYSEVIVDDDDEEDDDEEEGVGESSTPTACACKYCRSLSG